MVDNTAGLVFNNPGSNAAELLINHDKVLGTNRRNSFLNITNLKYNHNQELFNILPLQTSSAVYNVFLEDGTKWLDDPQTLSNFYNSFFLGSQVRFIGKTLVDYELGTLLRTTDNTSFTPSNNQRSHIRVAEIDTILSVSGDPIGPKYFRAMLNQDVTNNVGLFKFDDIAVTQPLDVIPAGTQIRLVIGVKTMMDISINFVGNRAGIMGKPWDE